MRKRAPASEIVRLAAPLGRAAEAVWQRMHWWIAILAILYALSGLTVVQPGEVGVVLRWGRAVGGVHGSGLTFAWPRPIDEVVHVQVKHVRELDVTALSNRGFSSGTTIDPVKVGYALTGDQNIVHVEMVAHYQISDPVAWAFYGASADDVLRVEVTAAMVRSLGEVGVDRVLSDGRSALIALASKRAQDGLDAARSGVTLTSLEVTQLAPPGAVASDFDAVQSAIIGATTAQKEAEAYAARAVPDAQAAADKELQQARADAASELARAQGDAQAFLALDKEYRAKPAVVRERLYRDAVDKAISSADSVRWVPPPVGGHYSELRIEIAPGYPGRPATAPAPAPAPATTGDGGGD